MHTSFEGELGDRSAWALEHCSIAMTMDAIGQRSSILILREAFYGITRFDDFVRFTQGSEANVAVRLKHLTGLGLFTKHPYQDHGKRTRYEYVLTDKGSDLLPALFALLQWGDNYLQPEGTRPLRLEERATGEPVRIVARGASGTDLSLNDIAIIMDSNRASALTKNV
ncbi:helix-turn-helix transcriptional regulator [Actinoplanes sp. TBRC 11911]|uniref:winged helix-turn-helix transcriptional regulator n=1 Tax=Actinoplanes sp. TBRC 11911 TaxID=2729386 RepID=UPI00145F4E26|nr:helix-turn-helix domain-containing protein [Actinoplanes sp. TBRC 11911]NMO55406.1 helix-turn-helix transcriptional regulator [Actinoplanes sp. TBRC 11911]